MESTVGRSMKAIRKNFHTLESFTLEFSTEPDLDMECFYVDFSGKARLILFSQQIWPDEDGRLQPVHMIR